MVDAAPKGVFSLPAFRTLWIAQFVSVFGDFLALFGVISLITFKFHGTAAQVALAMASYMAPVALVGPFAGVLVDRWHAKRVMIASDLLRAGIATSLLFVHDVRSIALVLAALGLVSSFFGPAQAVAIRTLVPKEQLLPANALLAQAFYAVRIVSPAIAGALVSWFGEKSCFWIDVGSFVISAGLLSTLVIARPELRHDGSVKALARDFTEANRFIFTHRALSFAFIASAVAMFMLSSFSPLISVYIRDILALGPLVYGGISAMVGVGLIVGSVLVRSAAKDRPLLNLVVGGLFGLGLGAALLGVFSWTITAALATFTVGFGIAFVVVPAQALSQKETSPEMQGRVSSTFMALFSLAQVLGMLLSGLLANLLGVRGLFLAAGAVLMVLAPGAWTAMRPRPQPAVQ